LPAGGLPVCYRPGYNSNMIILGLDLGERRVGVAISDPSGKIATPLLQFEPKNRRDLIQYVVHLAAEHGVQRVVVGLPLLTDGTVGEQARRTQAVVDILKTTLAVSVATWDERFSTAEADAAMRGAGLSPAERKARRDKVAASLILQSYLDSGCPL
jgi:putative holliday junction resolvase